MAEETRELPEVQDIPVEEGAGRDADNAEDVVIDLSLLSSMEEKLVSTYRTNPSPFTICRVPANIRECDHAAYDPRIVSIGPFHRGRKNLQSMEEHKGRYLHKVLACPQLGNNLEKFLKEMKALETQARDCYSGNIQMSSKEFVEMMMLDGCFVIFLILQQINSVEKDEFIYGNDWMLRLIKLDMLLLENQLPFFVLECLWDLIGKPRAILRNGVLRSFEFYFSCKLQLESHEEHDILHFLHLVHLSLKPDSPIRKDRITDMMIPSATELKEAGVRFKLKKAKRFLEVRFEQGLMEMPFLWIYDDAPILFRNLIAFEQCFPKWGNHCTTYCIFIDFLVNTPKDVSILREADIIRNGLGSNEEVALLFNKLCKEISWSVCGTYLVDLFEEVDKHTRNSWHIWRAKLVRDYFGSPWAIISLIAAVIILILTFLQTYFSVFAYFKPPKPP